MTPKMKKGDNFGSILNFRKGNVKLFGFFLGVATLFLLLSKFSESYTHNIKLKVNLYNLDDEVVIENDSTSEATVFIKTKGFSLLPFLFNSSRTIALDAKDEVSKTKDRYYWSTSSNLYKIKDVFGSSVDVLDVEPDTIRISYSTLENKKVPVKLVSNLTFSSGYDVVDNIKMSVDSVKIIGSKTLIDSILEIKTEALQLTELRKDIIETLSFDASSNIEIIPPNVEVTAKVMVFTEGQFSLPVELVNISHKKKINFFPKTVNLNYYVDVENFKKVKPSDFKIVADFKTIDISDTQSVLLKVEKFPEVIKSFRLQQNRVQFIISQ